MTLATTEHPTPSRTYKRLLTLKALIRECPEVFKHFWISDADEWLDWSEDRLSIDEDLGRYLVISRAPGESAARSAHNMPALRRVLIAESQRADTWEVLAVFDLDAQCQMQWEVRHICIVKRAV